MGNEMKVIVVEQNEKGYLEKKNGNLAYLYDKTANAGSNNYTKYWQEMKKEWQGSPWCQCFQGWSFLNAYGEELAQALLCGGVYSYYCPANVLFFKNAGRWITKDYQPGDVVYFRYSGSEAAHVGLIVAVVVNTLYVIEGNTSSGDNTVIPNGGAVVEKKYNLPTATYIMGAGRPDYSMLEGHKFAPSNVCNRAMAVTMLYALCGRNKSSIEINFSDVSKDNYFYDPVKWAVEHNIAVGSSNTKFNPYGYCTRAMFVQMMWRVSGSPKVSISMPFEDVSAERWYHDAVAWAYKHGITSGVSKTEFKPNNKITRAQAITMLYAAQGKPVVSGTMPFDDVVSGDYFYSAVLWGSSKKIISGVS